MNSFKKYLEKREAAHTAAIADQSKVFLAHLKARDESLERITAEVLETAKTSHEMLGRVSELLSALN